MAWQACYLDMDHIGNSFQCYQDMSYDIDGILVQLQLCLSFPPNFLLWTGADGGFQAFHKRYDTLCCTMLPTGLYLEAEDICRRFGMLKFKLAIQTSNVEDPSSR